MGARTEADGVIFGFDTFKPHTFVDAFRFMADNPGLMWQKTVEHLQISGLAMGIALVISIPLGVWLGHVHRGAFLAINLSNIGRALPSLAVIAIGLGQPIFYGLQTDFTTEFVATGALAISLAIGADAVLVIAQRALTPWARAGRHR